MPLNIIRGLFRGATRGVMTGKRGNKNFYKGKRSLILINVAPVEIYYRIQGKFSRLGSPD